MRHKSGVQLVADEIKNILRRKSGYLKVIPDNQGGWIDIRSGNRNGRFDRYERRALVWAELAPSENDTCECYSIAPGEGQAVRDRLLEILEGERQNQVWYLVVAHGLEESTPLYWSNDFGWTGYCSEATLYTQRERDVYALPTVFRGTVDWERVPDDSTETVPCVEEQSVTNPNFFIDITDLNQ
jgi:hypothetical protein